MYFTKGNGQFKDWDIMKIFRTCKRQLPWKTIFANPEITWMPVMHMVQYGTIPVQKIRPYLLPEEITPVCEGC